MKKFLLVFALLLLNSTSVFADSANVGGTGNTVKMLNNEDVQMVSEVINLTVGSEPKISDVYGEVFGGYINVEVEYLFKNTSDKAVNVQMGFPEECGGSCYMDDPQFANEFLGQYENYKLLNFKAFDSDHEYSVTMKQGEEDDYGSGKNWYTYEVNFAPGEEQTITNSYWIAPYSYKSGSRWFKYILETGASWKGVIESVDVYLNFEGDMTVYDAISLEPFGFKYGAMAGNISWHFDNIEPGEMDNIAISYRDPNGGDFGCDMAFEDEGEYNGGKASSNLPTEGDYYYSPCKGYDRDKSTAWVEGVEGDGEGEWLEVNIEPDKTYREMRIFNGYGSSKDIWEKNNRVKKAKLTFPNGTSQIIELADSYGYQFVDIAPPVFVPVDNTVKAKFEILDIYQGTKFNDTALSEIQFLGEIPLSAFSDTAGHLYEDAIKFVKIRGIVNGYDDGTYKPDKTVNRAEMMKIIIEAEYPGDAVGSNCFKDVKNEWFAKYICFAKDKGIVNGYEDGSFKPDQAVNYVEALKMTLETMDGYFEEVEGHWYQKYLNRADDLAASVADTKYDEAFSRGKMAQLIKNVLMAD